MTSIIDRIHEDIEDYEWLCYKYGEKPVTDNTGPDPYCDHAHKLKQRSRDEFTLKDKLAKLIVEAKEKGFVITVETRPLQPLAMRNYEMIGEVRFRR